MKQIIILGSTGSIGTSSLDVISQLGSGYRVLGISANTNTDLFLKQIHTFRPRFAAVLNSECYQKIKDQIPPSTRLLPPEIDSLCFMASLPSATLVINGVVGAVGFQPLIAAIKAGKTVALANKEPMVMAGKTLMKECERWKGAILPVDSEPSAIFQCLQGCPEGALKKIILTASGGAFFGKKKWELENVSVKKALQHPNWNMGAKITVDSATMMNKGLEVIEASWLFDCSDEDIDVLIHRESIIHSMIQLKDNAVIAQLGVPDMRIPIQYALTYPERMPSPTEQLDLSEITNLSFYKPDYENFKCINICKEAISRGGLYPTIVNAANEVAVELFLTGKIGFLDIERCVSEATKMKNVGELKSISSILEIDKKTRNFVLNYFKR